MKYLLFIFLSVLYMNIDAQCIVDAGPDIYVCVDKFGVTDSSVIQAQVTSTIPIQSVKWEAKHSLGLVSIPYLYSSHFLNDTTIVNPKIILSDGAPNNQPINFTISLTDSLGNVCIDSTNVYFSHYVVTTAFGNDKTINEGDSTILSSPIGGGIPPLTIVWSPNYNTLENAVGNVVAWPMVSTAYTSIVTDSVGCVCSFETGMFVEVLPYGTDIEDLTENKLNIYPNPTNEILNVFYEKEINSIRISLTNSMGQKVVEQPIINNQIDLGDLSKGIYYFEIKDEEKLISKGKIVKE